MNIYVPNPDYLQKIYDDLESQQKSINSSLTYYEKENLAAMEAFRENIELLCKRQNQYLGLIKEIIYKIRESLGQSNPLSPARLS